MNATLHRLHSPDVADLERYVPDDEDVGLLVQAMIGPAGMEGEESFDLMVCTPRWLAMHIGSRHLFGRHYLFLPRYDYAALRAAIENLCRLAEGDDWGAVASLYRALCAVGV